MDTYFQDRVRRNRFVWGLVLAWAPAVPLLIGMSNVFRGVSKKKATGLGAVAGGLMEAYLLLGMAAALAFQIGGMVLLVKSLSGENTGRTFFSLVSIAWSVLALGIFGLFLWLNFVFLRHR